MPQSSARWSAGNSETVDLWLTRRLPDRVREALRREIARGRWTAYLPSERHLSEHLQVSRPTVHLALTALAREGVIQARAGNRWRIAESIRKSQLDSGRRAAVVLLRSGSKTVPDLTSMLLFVDLLRAQLHRLGYDLHVADPSVEGASRLDAILSQLDAEYRPSFYILHSIPPAFHRRFERQEVPAIIVGSHEPDSGLPSIDINPDLLMRHAVHYLAGRGHRRIALLNLPSGSLGVSRRKEIFLRSCKERARDGVSGLVITSPSRPDAVEAAVRRMFRRRPPTAVVVTQLEYLIELYTTLGQLGLRIPQDVSVLSEYYLPVMAFLRPVPTAYDWPTQSFVTRIIRLMRDYLRLRIWPRASWNIIPDLKEGRSVATIRHRID